MTKSNKPFIEQYLRFIIMVYSFILLFRSFETFLLFHNYGFRISVLKSEFIGFLYDILGANIFIVAYSAINYLLYKRYRNLARIINASLFVIASVLFFIIIKYFLYQQIPLDIFVYQHTVSEVLFTINTSSISYLQSIITFMVILLFSGVLSIVVQKISIKGVVAKMVISFVLISLPLVIILRVSGFAMVDNYSMNKPYYFIKKSVEYFIGAPKTSENSLADFRNFYPDRKFINSEYPLQHKADRNDDLGKYFNRFEKSPNIVILIVEGLGDDFIHPYKGALMMPFLNSLKDKCLYWNRCFTLGERSFAAVPSLLGGLPYGDRGFTLQERLPRHLSLVSVLKSNNYYTSFFYGQGSWFHRKDRFFRYNNIDLLFDNCKFSERYDKIIVGSDNFFWGYNDKDLFSQSLQVIDTLNKDKRLDIYFTGTSHSPFVINNESYYNNRLNEILNEQNSEFFSTYSLYVKSLLFVDDALNDFFREYKTRHDYENTVFIITGDHPMTEIPIANSLKRYHVPLLIFSEKLKDSKVFSNPVSHLDVSETILSFLGSYGLHTPATSTSLGETLFPKSEKKHRRFAFMNTNREVIDFLEDNFYLSANNLYRVDSLLNLEKVDNSTKKLELSEKLNNFNSAGLRVARNNKIISAESYCNELNLVNLYNSRKTDTVQISAEYFDLTSKTPIDNLKFVYDIAFNITTSEKKNLSVVYQISNSKDSTLLWKNFDVGESSLIQEHIPIEKLPLSDSVLYFKSYIWNKEKLEYTISDIDVLLYSFGKNL